MARPRLKPIHYPVSNRVTKFSPDTLKKLEEASAVRLNVKSACAYAGISRETYYRWMKDIPNLSDRLDDLRENPIIRAKKTIIGKLDTDVNVAFKFLEKETPEDYGEKVMIEHSGEIKDTGYKALVNEFHTKLKNMIKNRSLDQAKKDGEL